MPHQIDLIIEREPETERAILAHAAHLQGPHHDPQLHNTTWCLQQMFASDNKKTNPFLGLHAAVTRQRADGSPGPEGWYPQQRLAMRDAIAGFTLGPAYAAGMEDRSGKLAPGYLADLIALTEDPFETPSVNLLEMESSATMVGGEWIWQS